MQEPKDDKDKEHCENINKYINNPPQPSTEPGLGELGGMGLNRNQLLQILGGNPSSFGGLSNLLGLTGAGRGRSTNPPASTQSQPATRPQASQSTTSAKPPSSNTNTNTTTVSQTPAANGLNRPKPPSQPANSALQLDTLQQLLSQITQQPKEPSLKDIINVDEILASGLFDQPDVVAKLAEFLPEGQITVANLRENIRSPQFQQAVAMFNQALRTGQLSGIMSSFGLDPSSVGPNSTIEDFLRAIQKKVEQEKQSGNY